MHVRWEKHWWELVCPTSDVTHGYVLYAALISDSYKWKLKRNQYCKASDLRSCSSIYTVVLSRCGEMACARPATPSRAWGKPSATCVLTRWVLLGWALSLRTAGHHLCKRKAVGRYKLEKDLTLLLAFLYYAGQRKGINSKGIWILKMSIKKSKLLSIKLRHYTAFFKASCYKIVISIPKDGHFS